MRLLKDEIEMILDNYSLGTYDEISDEIMIMLSKRFELTSLELNTKAGVKITSDNTNKNTKIEMVDTGKKLTNVTAVDWTIGSGDKLGRLTLKFT